MNLDLNLLPSQAKFHSARLKLRSGLMRITAVITMGLVLLVVIVWGYWWWASRNLTKIEASYGESVAKPALEKEVGVVGYDLKYRAKLIGQLLENRYEYGRSFQKVWRLTSPVVQMKESRMTDDGIFDVKLEIKGIEAMVGFEDKIKDVDEGRSDDYALIKLKSVEVVGQDWAVAAEVKLK